MFTEAVLSQPRGRTLVVTFDGQEKQAAILFRG
jgi:hypothetical protein